MTTGGEEKPRKGGFVANARRNKISGMREFKDTLISLSLALYEVITVVVWASYGLHFITLSLAH